jgi:hypothetical protein
MERKGKQMVEAHAGKTQALQLAEEYRRLGGTRLAKMDDNFVSTRKWDDEPAEASRFWHDRVESLDERHQAEVVSHLKSMNS